MHNPEEGLVSGLCSSSHEGTVTTHATELGSHWVGAYCSSKRELRIEPKVKRKDRGKRERGQCISAWVDASVVSSKYCNSFLRDKELARFLLACRL